MIFPLNLFPRESGKQAAEADSSPKPAADVPSTGDASKGASRGEPKSLLGAHKGKLAVGAAAMLGIAIFYRWRENRLAKEDPEQYAQLKRLKAAIAAGIAQSEPPAEQRATPTTCGAT